MASVKTGISKPKGIPTPGRAGFVLGSRPESLRAPKPKAMKADTRNYGKMSFMTGGGFGTTGETREP